MGATTDRWIHEAPVRRESPVAPPRNRDGCFGASRLTSEEAIAFAMLAEALRGTLPK